MLMSKSLSIIIGDSEDGNMTIKPKSQDTKRNRRCVSFAAENNLVSALSVNRSESIPLDSLEMARKSSNDEEDCDSVSLSKLKKEKFTVNSR